LAAPDDGIRCDGVHLLGEGVGDGGLADAGLAGDEDDLSARLVRQEPMAMQQGECVVAAGEPRRGGLDEGGRGGRLPYRFVE